MNQEEFETRLRTEISSKRNNIVAFYLCMRQGEIIKLTWSSVDLEEGHKTASRKKQEQSLEGCPHTSVR